MGCLTTSPYACKETSISDREVEVLVELVPKIEQQKMKRYVISTMYDNGYDLLKFEKRSFGDLIFVFRKNRNVDWNRYNKLKDEWLNTEAQKLVDQGRFKSILGAILYITHPYFGYDEPEEFLTSCTTPID